MPLDHNPFRFPYRPIIESKSMKELLTKAVNRTQATILQGSCSTTKLLWHCIKYPHYIEGI